MSQNSSTHLNDSSAASSETLELKAVIAVLAQRLDELTARVDELDPAVANQRLLEEQQEALAARNRQAAEQGNSYEQSSIRAEAERMARDIHERTPLASERSMSKLYESGRLGRHTAGAPEIVEELQRLGWSD